MYGRFCIDNSIYLSHFLYIGQALFEAGNRLKGADQDMSFLRSEVERLSAALQESDSRGRSQQAGGSQFLEKDLVQLRREVCSILA